MSTMEVSTTAYVAAGAVAAAGLLRWARTAGGRGASSPAGRLSTRVVSEAEGDSAVFTEMARLAQAPGVISLGQGCANFAIPRACIDSASVAVQTVALNQYSSIRGLASLRGAITAFHERRYGVTYNPDMDVVVTTGGTEALYAGMQALLNPGDECIMFEPLFPWCVLRLKRQRLRGLAGRRVGRIRLREGLRLEG